jgi:transcriptional regulator with XRE-family HTH domain
MFSKRLRELRGSRGLTMKELGMIFGLAESTVSGYENNFRHPDINTIIAIADHFDISVDYLLGRTDNKYVNDPEEIETFRLIEDCLGPSFLKQFRSLPDLKQVYFKNCISAA